MMLLVFSTACTSQAIKKRVKQLEQKVARNSQYLERLDEFLAKAQQRILRVEILQKLQSQRLKKKITQLESKSIAEAQNSVINNTDPYVLPNKAYRGKVSNSEGLAIRIPIAKPVIGPKSPAKSYADLYSEMRYSTGNEEVYDGPTYHEQPQSLIDYWFIRYQRR